jgi:hypothetical protein
LPFPIKKYHKWSEESHTKTTNGHGTTTTVSIRQDSSQWKKRQTEKKREVEFTPKDLGTGSSMRSAIKIAIHTMGTMEAAKSPKADVCFMACQMTDLSYCCCLVSRSSRVKMI